MYFLVAKGPMLLIGAALKNFPPQNQKKLVKVPRTQQSKRQKVRTNPSHAPPPQIADFRSQRVERKLTPRSILRNIHVALSQL